MGRMLSSGPPPASGKNVIDLPPKRVTPASGFPQFSFPTAQQQFNSPASIAFYLGAAVVFVRMSVLPEVMVYLTGANTYLLYLVGPPALLAVLFTGGLARVFRAKAAQYWTALFVWMILATPFSIWQGGSFQSVSAYARTCYICLLVVAGTVSNWKEIRALFNYMAVAGMVVLLVVRFLAKPDAEGRLSFDVIDSTIGNANDLAAHVILLMPFMAYLAFKPKGNIILRIVGAGCTFYCLWVILGTSSRGALIGLVCMALFLFFKASGSQRIAVLVGVPILTVVLMGILPAQNRARLATIFALDDPGAPNSVAAEAAESRESRTYLLKKSVEYTFKHPIFGVGPPSFPITRGTPAMCWARTAVGTKRIILTLKSPASAVSPV